MNDESDLVWIEYEGTITGETSKAVFIRSDGGEKITLPKSQIGMFNYPDCGGDKNEILIGEFITGVEVQGWLAEKEGFA